MRHNAINSMEIGEKILVDNMIGSNNMGSWVGQQNTDEWDDMLFLKSSFVFKI